jgi:hypothetical protein
MSPRELLAKHGIKLADTSPGQHYTTCPRCSAKRTPKNRSVTCLGVKIESDERACWHCCHCEWSGPDKGTGGGNSGGDGFAATYDYCLGGIVQFQKVRNPPGRKSRFWIRRPDGKGGWIKSAGNADTTILYRIDEVRSAIEAGQCIAVVEGEKDVNNLWALGIPATCNAHGAADPTKKQKPKWKAEHSEQLRGADLVILNDNDAAGYAHADAIVRLSLGVAKRVRRLDLKPHWPDIPKGGDVSDWLSLGHTREELEKLIEAAPVVEAKSEPKPEPKPEPSQKAADVLIALSARAEELFHAPDSTAFAVVPVGDHFETWPVRSRGFKRWLAREFFAETESAPNSDAIQAALNVIEAKAHFDGRQRPVHVRIGACDDRLYLDLADARWRAIEISADGWRIVDHPPVAFRRAAGMQALPEPIRGGSIEELRPFLNVKQKDDKGNGKQKDDKGDDDKDFVLTVSYICAALRERGPYPVLALIGEHGAAKSAFTKILRKLLDPNSAPLRSLPREDRDLFIAASNGHLLAFDNVSKLPDWISDTLCRLATGGGFATRQLYSDQDEMLFDAMRPIILNGIEDMVARPDLADRSIFLTLENIADDKRKAEAELLAEFDRAHPRILGALLDGIAHGLRQLPKIRLARTPRMADFALWASACETAFWDAGTFIKAYGANREEAVVTVIEADLVATAVQSFMADRPDLKEHPTLINQGDVWTGTSSDLLGALKMAGGDQAKLKEWPQTPRALSGRLRRAAATLRKVGIEITFERQSGGKSSGKRIRTITIARQKGGDDRPHGPYRPQSQDFNDIDRDATGDDQDDDGAIVPSTVPDNPLENKARDGVDDGDAKFPSLTGTPYDDEEPPPLVPCAHCGRADGEVFEVNDLRRGTAFNGATGAPIGCPTIPLHEACTQPFFAAATKQTAAQANGRGARPVPQGVSERTIRSIGDEYTERAYANAQANGGDTRTAECDAWLRQKLADEGVLPEHIETEFKRVMQVLFGPK